MKVQSNYNKYQESFAINYTDCDMFGKLKMSSVLKFMTITSYKQSEQIGIDDAYLKKNEINWIIHELRCEVQELPLYQDTLTVSVYSTAYNKFFMYRQVDLYSEKKGYLGKLVLSLSLMAITSRKIQTIQEEVGEAFGAPKIKKIERFPKIKFSNSEIYSSIKKSVCFSHLDMNQHVSNSVYLDWLLDSQSEKFLASHRLTSFSIRFENECFIGEKLTIEGVVDCREKDVQTVWTIREKDVIKARAQAHWLKVD